jgi:CRISPR type III-B/RAMP module RAMP protein Cmr6
MTYYLPNETARMIERRIRACNNLGLVLDKYIPISVFEKPDRNNKNKGKTPWLLNILEPLDVKNTDNNQTKHIDFDLAHNAYLRWQTLTKAIGAQPFELRLDWRMVVGLGGETVLETDITLHPLYGIPFIPGSALKGLTRAYVTREYEKYYVSEDKLEASKNADDDHPEIKGIFGSKDNAGTVIFFDAMPLNGRIVFELDIMNPHYPKYYGENAFPTNDQDPNPITFLTVANTTFSFALAPRNTNDANHKAHVQLVKGWLQEALQK